MAETDNNGRDDTQEAQAEERDANERREAKETEQNRQAAIDRAGDRAHEYQVHGYDRQDDGYGGPYHPDAFQDPQVKFALAGDPEAQEQFTKELQELDEAKAKSGNGVDKVDVVAASAHSTVVEEAPYRAAAATPELAATHENVDEAAARKHLVVPRSDETEAEAFDRVANKADDTGETDEEAPSRRTEPARSEEDDEDRAETKRNAQRSAFSFEDPNETNEVNEAHTEAAREDAKNDAKDAGTP